MKSILSVLALAFGALTFQSCEDYPSGASRGYYHGGYYGGTGYDPGYTDSGYYGGGYYDGGYYGGGGIVVSSGDREHYHGHGYPNGYYDRGNDHHQRDAHRSPIRARQSKQRAGQSEPAH